MNRYIAMLSLVALVGLAIAVIALPRFVDLSGGGRFDHKKNVPFHFYGKVIDGDGNALAGASVTVAVDRAVWEKLGGIAEVRRIPQQVTSDGMGLFRITGDGLGVAIVSLDAPGHRFIRSANYISFPDSPIFNANYFRIRSEFGHDDYVPDPASPALFVMVRDGERTVRAKMSRGGKDIRANGAVIVNEPFWPNNTDPPGITYVAPASE